MSSRCLRALALIALTALATAPARAQAPAATLRVCADPNNLPFSNAREEGFENRIAQLIAADLNVRLAYVWWAQRRGFIRNTLNAGACDLVAGVPADDERTLTTRADVVAELAQIRQAGYSVDDEERNRGVTCMAVLLPTEEPPAIALSVSAPSGELRPAARETLLPVLRAAAAELVALPGFDTALAPLRTRMALA